VASTGRRVIWEEVDLMKDIVWRVLWICTEKRYVIERVESITKSKEFCVEA
jgi:hypothetical protein